MTPPAALETTRLLLRPMQPSDIEGLLHILGDPKVTAAFNELAFNREQIERWIQRNLAHQVRYGYGLFSVIHQADRRLIGDCGLEHMEVAGEMAAELGYDFRSDYWNQGYATEAACAVRDYAFQALHLPRLVSLIRVGNQASRRVAEKVGMTLVREITRYEWRYWEYELKRLI